MHMPYAVKIVGVSPLLLHRGGLASPLDPWAKAMREITGKRKKTEADHAELARLEWYGSMYRDAEDRPCIPGECIEGMLGQAAAKFRLKQVVRSAVISDGNWPILYDGPATIDELWADGRFVDSRLESVQSGKVVRTRPRFDSWALEFDLDVDTDQLNPDQLRQILLTAGQVVSLGDRRPKFGRFDVKSLRQLRDKAA